MEATMGGEAQVRRPLETPGPLTAALNHVLDIIQTKQFSRALDEETLTAAIFGGLAASVALFVRCYGSGVEGVTRECSWGPFKKSRPTKPKAGEEHDRRIKTEPESGADFALVLWQTADEAMVALLQAKKGQAEPDNSGKNWLNIHRDPNETTGKTQFVMLAAMCLLMQKQSACNSSLTNTIAAARSFTGVLPAERKKLVESFTWAHYLVYVDDTPVCVPVTAIESSAIEAEVGGRSAPRIPVDIRLADKFVDLVRRGILGIGDGWLRMSKAQIETVLPSLIDLMDVYEVSERGGVGLESKFANKQTTSITAPATNARRAAMLSNVINGKATLGVSPTTRPTRRGCGP